MIVKGDSEMSNIDEENEKDKELEKKLEFLERTYDRQHYFVDRHEVMAEKVLTVLMITGGFVSICVTFFSKYSSELTPFGEYLLYFSTITAIIFTIFFIISFYLVIQAIRPLSSKALDKLDDKFIPNGNMLWIDSSIIYYRGILKFLDSVPKDKDPIKEYSEKIGMENIINNYIAQIYILSFYSNYKRIKLEKAMKYATYTIILGILTLVISSSLFIYIQ